jgi:DNA-binding transcriptional LysR family regulator
MDNLDWNDLRYVLAAVRNGSAAAAARSLRISHATVLRRLQEIELGFGLKIFGRTSSGHELTKEGRVIFELAEFVEAQVTHTRRLVDAQGSEMDGEIRFTTTDALFTAAVMPLLASFHLRFPAVKVRTSVGSAVLDIEKREADIALRPSVEPPDSLVGLRLCRLDFSVYASPIYLSQNAATPPAEMAWLMPDESLSRTPIFRSEGQPGTFARAACIQLLRRASAGRGSRSRGRRAAEVSRARIEVAGRRDQHSAVGVHRSVAADPSQFAPHAARAGLHGPHCAGDSRAAHGVRIERRLSLGSAAKRPAFWCTRCTKHVPHDGNHVIASAPQKAAPRPSSPRQHRS